MLPIQKKNDSKPVLRHNPPEVLIYTLEEHPRFNLSPWSCSQILLTGTCHPPVEGSVTDAHSNWEFAASHMENIPPDAVQL